MRDLARSLLHVRAKADGFDGDVAEFMMGHTSRLDPLKYDKFYLDQEYMRAQYLIAEKYLNLLTASAPSEEEKQLRDRVAHLEVALQMLQDASGLKITSPAVGR
jgi:hypothetical protein